MKCCKCNNVATKIWYEEHFCLECWIKEADVIYYDNGKMYKRLSKKLFIK